MRLGVRFEHYGENNEFLRVAGIPQSQAEGWSRLCESFGRSGVMLPACLSSASVFPEGRAATHTQRETLFSWDNNPFIKVSHTNWILTQNQCTTDTTAMCWTRRANEGGELVPCHTLHGGGSGPGGEGGNVAVCLWGFC